MLPFDPWKWWWKGWVLDGKTREPLGVEVDINRGNNSYHPHTLASACPRYYLYSFIYQDPRIVKTFPRSQRQDFMST